MKNNEIKIKNRSSSLSEFIKRQLPSDEEVEAFDDYATSEAKGEEINDSLARIYRDDQGNNINSGKLIIKPKRGWFFKLFTFLIVIFVFAGALYASYRYVYLQFFNTRPTVAVSFDSNSETAAGKEFYYNLNYKNEDRVGIHNIEIIAAYPDNFIFIESEPAPSKNNNIWDIAALGSHRSDSIRIKGKLIGLSGGGNIISAGITYTPDNFSSEFKQSASFETKINDTGLDISVANASSALVGEDNEITIKFKTKTENYLDNFRLTVEHPDEAVITGPAPTASSTGLTIQSGGQDSWLLNNLGKNENNIKIKFKIKDKKQPSLNLKLKFEYPYAAAGQPARYYLFDEKSLTFDVIKSDLNINLAVNGSAFDQGVNSGQTLNYQISYKNTGASAMKNIIIMAVLESDFLDWPSLSDSYNGAVSGNTISWSNQEIPALGELTSDGSGEINFSIKLKPQAQIDLSRAYQVKSYVNYSVEGKSAAGANQSNIIINKINTDLAASAELRYFNSDNLAVGSGPLPPKVGQATSLKAYWTVSNNLHELNNLRFSVILPANVNWDGKNRASYGTVDYNSQTREVFWQVDRLPIAVNQATAEFNVSLLPTQADQDKIMIVLPQTNVGAQDGETKSQINKTLKAKTTKLEDDNLANTDGLVQ